MTDLVAFTADDREVLAPAGSSLLDALRSAGIEVPGLCHHESVRPYGACRLCLVEVETSSHGRPRRRMTTSCDFPVFAGLRVFTDTEEVAAQRKVVFELLLAQAPGSRPLAELAARYGVRATRLPGRGEDCILCGLCARVCREVVRVDAIDFSGRGESRLLGAPFGDAAERCTGCGACAFVCPVGCIQVRDEGGMRHIDRFAVRRELVRCVECGGVVGTKAQLDRLRARLPAEAAIYTRCVDCRRLYYQTRVAAEGHM